MLNLSYFLTHSQILRRETIFITFNILIKNPGHYQTSYQYKD